MRDVCARVCVFRSTAMAAVKCCLFGDQKGSSMEINVSFVL